jgi:hypothetical protein
MENRAAIGLYYAGYMFLLGTFGAIFGLVFAIFALRCGSFRDLTLIL